MKNKYILKNIIAFKAFLPLAFLFSNINAFSQQRVPFVPRSALESPTRKNYNIQGDFTMVGNTNLTLQNYTDNGSNGSAMIYVDVDNDASTFNSSSARFDHGSDASCTKIVYAGLYWTGRAHNDDTNSPNSFVASKTVQESVTANENQTVANNGSVNYSSYSLAVTRINNSNSDRYPLYTFSSNNGGTQIQFQLTNTNNLGTRLGYRYGNSGNYTNIALSSYTNGVATLQTPFTFNDGTLTIKINSFNRNTSATGNTDAYTNADNFASINLSGTGTRNVLRTKTLDKNKVKFKGPNGTYIDVSATNDAIFYPTSGSGVMYSAYADVTSYVRSHGIGDYFVADMAIQEGNTNGGTGYYGGWGMVIVYENPLLKWRNITVFDGHNYIMGGTTTSQALNINGFQAVQKGDVKIKMGMMAGEGDRAIAGDYFNVRDTTNNSWVALKHSGNTVDNFFNSSIVTGNNTRNPSLLNNTGVDISMFDLENTGNRIIKNNQTSTRFQYGSTQDTYIIFNITFAVDAYVPEVEVFNTTQSNVPNGGTVEPQQSLVFTSSIYNTGSEDVNNGIVKIPLPPNVHYVSSAILAGNGSVTWIHPFGTDPNVTPGGTLIWNIGNLPKPADPKQLLAKLQYTLRVTEDCTLLTTSGPCGLMINLDGTFEGQGALSGSNVSTGFVVGYNQNCGNTPIRNPYQMTIVPSTAFLANCPAGVVDGTKRFKAFCSIVGNVIPRASVINSYPAGTKFYSSSPETANYESSLVTGDFPANPNGASTRYYAIPYGMATGCFLRLETIIEKVITQPTAQNISYCFGSTAAPNTQLSSYGAANNLQLYYFADNTSSTPLTVVPTPAAVGSYTYYVAEGGTGNGTLCFGPRVSFKIDVYPVPVVTQNIDDFYVCMDGDKVVTVQASNSNNTEWQYFIAATSSWTALTSTIYPNVITISGSSLNINSAKSDIDGLKLRAKFTSVNGCIAFSNAVTLEVRTCNIITNPMIPAKFKGN